MGIMRGCSTSAVMGKKCHRQMKDGQEYALLVQLDANDLMQHDQDDVKIMGAKVKIRSLYNYVSYLFNVVSLQNKAVWL